MYRSAEWKLGNRDCLSNSAKVEKYGKIQHPAIGIKMCSKMQVVKTLSKKRGCRTIIRERHFLTIMFGNNYMRFKGVKSLLYSENAKANNKVCRNTNTPSTNHIKHITKSMPQHLWLKVLVNNIWNCIKFWVKVRSVFQCKLSSRNDDMCLGNTHRSLHKGQRCAQMQTVRVSRSLLKWRMKNTNIDNAEHEVA